MFLMKRDTTAVYDSERCNGKPYTAVTFSKINNTQKSLLKEITLKMACSTDIYSKRINKVLYKFCAFIYFLISHIKDESLARHYYFTRRNYL